MDLYQTQYEIFEQENTIQRVVLEGINAWNQEHEHPEIEEVSSYMIPLIRYAVEDWVGEFEHLLDRRPDTTFAEFVKEQEGMLLFHFKWSLTHKAETIFRHAHGELWQALDEDEQEAFLNGLRHLIQTSV